MSWKGVVKAVERLPAMVKSKANLLQKSHDPEFHRVEMEFAQMEADITQLLADAQRYRAAVAANALHQVRFAQTLKEMYVPSSSGHAVVEGNSASDSGAATAGDFQRELDASQLLLTLNQALGERLAPYLDRVDNEVIEPLKELCNRLGYVRKAIVKRSNKVLDHDRHQDTLQRLREKHQKQQGTSISGAAAAVSYDEQQKLAKQELVVATAAEMLQTHTAPLMQQLPMLLALRAPFTAHLARVFSHLQVAIFTAMSQTMQEFAKRGLVNVDCAVTAEYQIGREALDRIVRDIGGPEQGGAPSGTSGSPSGRSKGTASGAVAMLGETRSAVPETASSASIVLAPPPYAVVSSFAKAVESQSMPIPSNDRFVVALYDFTAQSPGDLSFSAGERIRVTEATGGREDWWRGEVAPGRSGSFPANYTEDT